MSIGRRIAFGFGFVLILLTVIGAISFIGVGGIVKNAEEVILGNNLDKSLAQREVDHLNWANKVNAFLNNDKVKKLEVESDYHKCAFGKWFYSDERVRTEKHFPDISPLLKEIEAPHQQLHLSGVELEKATSKEDARSVYINQTVQSLEEVQSLLHKIRETAKKHVMTEEKMLVAAQSTKRSVTIVGIFAIIIGIALAWIIGRGISTILRRVSDELGSAADQLSSSASQITAGSQSMAEGASEQASSLEETSSSLEEMSSMTKQNADHANQAKEMMTEASRIVDKVDHHMKDMAGAVAEITKSSEETSKIVKTIDEIAFQTNLLALNAAVEAARAGEAGAGFAVVADEVRNLAMRASEAAKNTSNLIENTIKAVRKGNELTSATQEAFLENAEISGKIGQLVDEIATASEEQSHGINQLNLAVAEMDKVTQSTAANAEESAAAAEELNAQADQMKGYVGDLLKAVGGSTNRVSSRGNADVPPPIRAATHKALSKAKTCGQRFDSGKTPKRIIHTGKVMPQEKADFNDF